MLQRSHPTWQRIASADILRGFALFGILVVYLTTFRLPTRCFTAPTAWRIA